MARTQVPSNVQHLGCIITSFSACMNPYRTSVGQVCVRLGVGTYVLDPGWRVLSTGSKPTRRQKDTEAH